MVAWCGGGRVLEYAGSPAWCTLQAALCKRVQGVALDDWIGFYLSVLTKVLASRRAKQLARQSCLEASTAEQ